MSNLTDMSIRDMGEGKWGLALPTPADAPIPLFNAEEDTGKFVKGIFLNNDKLLGERIYGATAYYTPTQIMEEFKRSYPKVADKASYTELPGEVYAGILGSMGLPERFQTEMVENHQLFSVAGYYGGAKLDSSHAVSISSSLRVTQHRTNNIQIVDEPLTTWKEYIAHHKAYDAIRG